MLYFVLHFNLNHFKLHSMKMNVFNLTASRTLLIAFATAATLSACQKENIKSPAVQAQSSTEENSDASVFMSTEGSNSKLVLRPGPGNGQDVYVEDRSGVSSGNMNYVPELPVNSWTGGGTYITTRSFIRFNDLSLIPSTATVVSAKLFLYGISQSLNSPQGNSYYPGSPYNGYGDNQCLVQKVVGANWDESTLTYGTQPSTTTTDQAILNPSTSQWNYNATVDVTRMVQSMVASPSTNYGFAIKLATEQLYRSIVFASSEEASRSLRPRLLVVYH